MPLCVCFFIGPIPKNGFLFTFSVFDHWVILALLYGSWYGMDLLQRDRYGFSIRTHQLYSMGLYYRFIWNGLIWAFSLSNWFHRICWSGAVFVCVCDHYIDIQTTTTKKQLKIAVKANNTTLHIIWLCFRNLSKLLRTSHGD